MNVFRDVRFFICGQVDHFAGAVFCWAHVEGIFKGSKANADEVEGFNRFIKKYSDCLSVEKAAIEKF